MVKCEDAERSSFKTVVLRLLFCCSIPFSCNGNSGIGKFIGITMTIANFFISCSWLWFGISRCRIFSITKNTIPWKVVIILKFDFFSSLLPSRNYQRRAVVIWSPSVIDSSLAIPIAHVTAFSIFVIFFILLKSDFLSVHR